MNKDLATGIKVIDHQHDEFHTMLDTFMLEMIDQVHTCDFASIQKYISFLDQYIAKHFTLEESIMMELEYPQQSEHKQQHSSFVECYNEFATDLKNNPITTEKLKEFHKFLLAWFNTDIREHDLEMAKFIKEKTKHDSSAVDKLNKLYKTNFKEHN